ncbi:MAG: hypothetical protein ACTHME_08955, partial [Candidatus Nitrosocosmicus sp.]
MTLFLFVGLSATFLISVSSSTLVYSLSNLTYNNTAKTVLTNQSSPSSILDFKQIPPKVTNFILNNVVNKSKAALVVG